MVNSEIEQRISENSKGWCAQIFNEIFSQFPDHCTVEPGEKETHFEKIPFIIAKYLSLGDPDIYIDYYRRRT